MKLLNQIKKKTNLGKYWLDEMKEREARMTPVQTTHLESLPRIITQPAQAQPFEPHLIFQTQQSDEQKLREIHEELERVSYRPVLALA